MSLAQGTETQAPQITGRLFQVLAFKCLSVYQLTILPFNYLYSTVWATRRTSRSLGALLSVLRSCMIEAPNATFGDVGQGRLHRQRLRVNVAASKQHTRSYCFFVNLPKFRERW